MCTTRRGTQQLYWIFKQQWHHIEASLIKLTYKTTAAYGAPTHVQVTMHFVVRATHRWHNLLPLQLLLPSAITIQAIVTLDLDAHLKIIRQVCRGLWYKPHWPCNAEAQADCWVNWPWSLVRLPRSIRRHVSVQ